jgi:hypothetical protein
MKRIYRTAFICAALLGSAHLFSVPAHPTPAPAKEKIAQPAAPVQKAVEPTSPSALLRSIQHDLQDSSYREILPSNFSYLIQLLEHGKRNQQSRDYAQNVISLFSKLLKGCEYVNSYSFNSLIDQMPGLVKHHFAGYQLDGMQLVLAQDLDMLERLEQAVTSIVYTKFSTDFNLCKSNPEQFLDDLSKRIVATTNQEVSMAQLRQIIIRFLEVGLSKLVWSPRDEEKTWDSVKKISHSLATLMEHKIIDDLDDIDELYWTLVHRYRYFLELHSTDMTLSSYSKIANDIHTQKLLLFDIEEQEPFMQTKSNCLLSAIATQEAKKRAYDYQIGQPRA